MFCPVCGKELGNSDFCLHCNKKIELDLSTQRVQNNSNSIIWTIIMLLIFGFILWKVGLVQALFNSFGLSTPSINLNIENQIVTFEKYNSIQTGMSYNQVISIIGDPGEEISNNKMEGVPGVMPSVETIMYQWTNSNGSNMNAMFQNNRLVSKAQAGLK